MSNPILRPCKAKTIDPNSWVRSRATEELEAVAVIGAMSTCDAENVEKVVELEKEFLFSLSDPRLRRNSKEVWKLKDKKIV